MELEELLESHWLDEGAGCPETGAPEEDAGNGEGCPDWVDAYEL